MYVCLAFFLPFCLLTLYPFADCAVPLPSSNDLAVCSILSVLTKASQSGPRQADRGAEAMSSPQKLNDATQQGEISQQGMTAQQKTEDDRTTEPTEIKPDVNVQVEAPVDVSGSGSSEVVLRCRNDDEPPRALTRRTAVGGGDVTGAAADTVAAPSAEIVADAAQLRAELEAAKSQLREARAQSDARYSELEAAKGQLVEMRTEAVATRTVNAMAIGGDDGMRAQMHSRAYSIDEPAHTPPSLFGRHRVGCSAADRGLSHRPHRCTMPSLSRPTITPRPPATQACWRPVGAVAAGLWPHVLEIAVYSPTGSTNTRACYKRTNCLSMQQRACKPITAP